MEMKLHIRRILFCILGSLILTATVMLLRDLYALWVRENLSCQRFWTDFAVLAVLLIIHFRKHPRFLFRASLIILACVCVTLGTGFFTWWQYYRSSAFPALDNGKQQLYAGKKVMIVVPHEDDDLNLMSGVLNEFVRYGSTVYPVFVTNGDHSGLGEVRILEALSVMERIGIPSENVIFLGYGDQYLSDGPHIYNAEPGQVVTSHNGANATYGIAAHAAYREGHSYTSDHFLKDIHDVIWEYQPDILFCSDFEDHADHRAVSLAFEKVIGILLKEHADYRPLVFKGCAYASAWRAPADFYTINILSTQKTSDTPAVYDWDERIRLPVWDCSLAHSLIRSEQAEELALYRSQRAYRYADAIVNGDKVFWFRNTNSLCYQSDIQVKSGDENLLNDFMLLDSKDVTDSSHLPTDGTWTPTDAEKTATVSFSEPQDIACIRLYDNPSINDNVLRCILSFSDGSSVECGPLPSQGSALTIPIEKNGITSFSVQLIETEGAYPGLTEIEAFSSSPDCELRFVKLMDAQGDFMYDYYMTSGNTMTIQIYSVGLTDAEIQNLTVHTDNPSCTASLQDGVIELTCPKGRSTTLTVQLEGSNLSDTIRIHHPWTLSRRFQTMLRQVDKEAYHIYEHYLKDPTAFLLNSAVCKMVFPELTQS